jgi:hypothetical protein
MHVREHEMNKAVLFARDSGFPPLPAFGLIIKEFGDYTLCIGG